MAPGSARAPAPARAARPARRAPPLVLSKAVDSTSGGDTDTYGLGDGLATHGIRCIRP